MKREGRMVIFFSPQIYGWSSLFYFDFWVFSFVVFILVVFYKKGKLLALEEF
jgi:hypothetical protein